MKFFGKKKRAEEDSSSASDATVAMTTVADEATDGRSASATASTEATAAAGATIGGGQEAAQERSIPLSAPTEDPASRADKGPWDESEADMSAANRVNLGALHIPGKEGLTLRLEVEESSEKVTAVNLALGQSSVQLQVFAAPRSEGIWDEIREELVAQVTGSGGTADEVPGHFGREVIAKIPSRTPTGQVVQQVARFAGVDGPRWFLRAVFSGPAAHDEESAADLESIIRGIVVARGEQARPPRELLDMHLPNATPTDDGAAEEESQTPDLGSLGRGPEVTRIG